MIDNGIRMPFESKKRDDNLTAQALVYELISDLLFENDIDAKINYDDGLSADLSVELSPAGVVRACLMYNTKGEDVNDG